MSTRVQTDPFAMLDLVEAQSKRADSLELATWKMSLVLIEVLDAIDLETAQRAARAYLETVYILGRRGDDLDDMSLKVFRSIVEKRDV